MKIPYFFLSFFLHFLLGGWGVGGRDEVSDHSYIRTRISFKLALSHYDYNYNQM